MSRAASSNGDPRPPSGRLDRALPRRLPPDLCVGCHGLLVASPWILDGTNYAIAQAGTLAAPTDATATANGSNAITVGWDLPGAPVARRAVQGHPHGRPRPRGCRVRGRHHVLPRHGSGCRHRIHLLDRGRDRGPLAVACRVRVGHDAGRDHHIPRAASVGETYSMALSAVGGSGPYTWALAPGSSELPSWADPQPRRNDHGYARCGRDDLRAGLHSDRFGRHGHVRSPRADRRARLDDHDRLTVGGHRDLWGGVCDRLRRHGAHGQR